LDPIHFCIGDGIIEGERDHHAIVATSSRKNGASRVIIIPVFDIPIAGYWWNGSIDGDTSRRGSDRTIPGNEISGSGKIEIKPPSILISHADLEVVGVGPIPVIRGVHFGHGHIVASMARIAQEEGGSGEKNYQGEELLGPHRRKDFAYQINNIRFKNRGETQEPGLT
jgi:hypothetical protein